METTCSILQRPSKTHTRQTQRVHAEDPRSRHWLPQGPAAAAADNSSLLTVVTTPSTCCSSSRNHGSC
jgi:hypothetical protein